jgi:hypothetical protein
MRTILARAAVCALALVIASQARPQAQPSPAEPVVIDRVVAVVNQRVILASDLDDEIRLSVLDPNIVGESPLTRQRALEQIISRALIEQQIRQEDERAVEPSQIEVDERLEELRKELPACVHANCSSSTT